MKTMSFITKKAAALAIAAAAAVSAQDLAATVPVSFSVNGAKFTPGEYRLTAGAVPGVVLLRNGAGRPLAIAPMLVQTRSGERTSESKLRFDLTESGYQLAEYCDAGRGCWAKPGNGKAAPAKSIEIAMSRR